MKLETPKNKNYAAVVVKITALIPLENCDNVVATNFFGYQAVVGKNTQVGDVGVMFPAETRLSEEYCEMNNLYRHNDLNFDKTQKGYIEDNRRVKAVKFRGHRSDCLFMPLESVGYFGVDIRELKEGDEFDQLDGHMICEKYERPVRENRSQRAIDKSFKRVDKKFLPEHYDNEHYLRNQENIPGEEMIYVTQKLHGTSIRVGNTIVLTKPTILSRIAKFLGIKVQEYSFDYVYGSRRVIKDVNNPNQQHFYGADVWTEAGKELVGLIPENYLVYGELVGYTNEGAAIQKDYTYACLPGTNRLYVYRVAIVNAQGIVADLSWDHVREFCAQRGLLHVPELWRGFKRDFDVTKYLDQKFSDGMYPVCNDGRTVADIPVALSDDKMVDEGVCVRVDTLVPTIYKAKSPIFLQHETELIDKGAEDIEAEQSAEETA